jgi:hypothetical protein
MKMDRRESDKDAAVKKAVKEIFLKDKIGCNHIGTLFVTSFRHSSNQRVGMMYQWVPPKYFSTRFGKGVDIRSPNRRVLSSRTGTKETIGRSLAG